MVLFAIVCGFRPSLVCQSSANWRHLIEMGPTYPINATLVGLISRILHNMFTFTSPWVAIVAIPPYNGARDKTPMIRLWPNHERRGIFP
jgi:hypothetical protein